MSDSAESPGESTSQLPAPSSENKEKSTIKKSPPSPGSPNNERPGKSPQPARKEEPTPPTLISPPPEALSAAPPAPPRDNSEESKILSFFAHLPPNLPNLSPPPTEHKPAPEPPRDENPRPAALTRSPDQGGGIISSSHNNLPLRVGVGVALASLFIIALVAMFLLMRKRRKSERSHGYFMGNKGEHLQRRTNGAVSWSMPSDLNYGNHRNMEAMGTPDSGYISSLKIIFQYEELMEITNAFSRENIVGEGGFGYVYKGWLPQAGKMVAVKQLKARGGEGDKEFRAEVDVISRVHHRHLVSLVGYCTAHNHRLLIYEFLPNKTLDHHLHGKDMPVLDWVKRVRIALGSAKGLAYLHEDCHPRIIHRDIKSSNILLDNDFEAQVADFGLARIHDTSQTHISTRVMGTFGYLAPEYASSGKLSDRSDVFSFGVVLLELITGRKPVDRNQPLEEESLVEWARPLLLDAIETGEFNKLVDPRLGRHYVEAEMFRMIDAAAACVRHSAIKRPRMTQVVRALDMDSDNSDLSKGVRYGQSSAYDSGRYNEEITRFRQMRDAGSSSELGINGSPYDSQKSSAEFLSSESEFHGHR